MEKLNKEGNQMQDFIKKILKWIPTNLGAILGIVQAVIKFGKEVCTLFIDILAPVIPGTKDDEIVAKVRDFFNLIDEWVETVKGWLLNIGG